jgi:hypothetical protein
MSWFPRGARLLALAALVVAAAPAAALANGPNAKVFPPDAHPYGKSYAEWSATWWPWALNEPAATNPVLDPTGANCAVGQSSSKVWLLAGTFGFNSPAVRACTVPKDRALLVPVLNNFWCVFPEDPPEQRTPEFIRAQMSFMRTDATGLSVTVDGVVVRDVASFYVESIPWPYAFRPGNIFGLDWICAPAVDFGYYVMVKPLSPGKHEIRFKGAFPGFQTDTIYELTVVRKHAGDDD